MRIIISLILLSFPYFVSATAQIADVVILEGRENSLFTEPFTEYLHSDPDELDKLTPFITETCSASWRGYQAHWEIKGDRLYLIAIHANPCNDNPTSVPLALFFPDTTGPVLATWYPGKLIMPKGKMTNYIHMGYESKYENYIVITIDNGQVTGQRIVDSLSSNEQ